MSKSQIAAVILAAGSSSRFGRPKQLLEWDGRPLILSAVDTAWAAGIGSHHCCTRCICRGDRAIVILHVPYRF